MLESLYIENFVLIDRLEVAFRPGFSVLTGETGAGKSILLDALGQVLGDRAQASYIRPNQKQAVVCATFKVDHLPAVQGILQEHGFDDEGSLILRRILTNDGRTKAFINDQPVGVSLLKALGEELIEIHGQFDQSISSASHRQLLDGFGGLAADLEVVSSAFQTFERARTRLAHIQAAIEGRHAQLEFLDAALKEFAEIAPQVGEEEALMERRSVALNAQKIQTTLSSAEAKLSGNQGVLSPLYAMQTSLEKIQEFMPEHIHPLLESLKGAIHALEEGDAQVQNLLKSDIFSGLGLDEIDDRLYQLRALSRKHGCLVAQLLDKRQAFQEEFEALSHAELTLRNEEKAFEDARKTFVSAAEVLSQKRQKIASSFKDAVEGELVPLKLEKTKIQVEITPLDENQWQSHGADHVEFLVQTNPGQPFGPMGKIASGGERSRLMLAFKVVLSSAQGQGILVFDEIDQGVGGAVAAAIGERLKSLSANHQVLSVTHAPQVAGFADTHYIVQKAVQAGQTHTSLFELTTEQRREEIARMLSGEDVSHEARAAAEKLLKTGS